MLVELPIGVNRNLTRMAMAVWGTMLAHQIAAKAFRDATFLSAWPAAALPLMTVVTAVLTAVLARLIARLSDRYPSAVVVACGLGVSAAGHIGEWVFYGAGRWNAVVIYLHLAGVTALLLSGFWSLIAERFDPEGARRPYGRIGAAGTAGLAGSIVAERIAVLLAPRSVLLLLAALHLLAVAGVLMMKRIPAMLPHAEPEDRGPRLGEIFQTVPAQKGRGYRLLDRPDSEHDLNGTREFPSDASRFLEYVFLLLSTIVPREPLDAAVRGIRSSSAGVRGLATEYFDQVLPQAVLARMRELFIRT